MLPGILFVLAIAVASGFNTRRLFRKKPATHDCLDVAIVGGGIGGTYTGWRLRQRGLNIAIFENTDRVGGRMFSVFLPSVPNVPAELGAMRYVPGAHSTLESLFPQLDLRTEVFQPDSFKKLFYFRSTRLSAEELDSPKLPYNLAPGESRNPDELSWTFSQRVMNVSRPDLIPDIEEAHTPDGVPVYQQGYLSVMGKIWSNEAKNYLRDVHAFRTLYEPNMNAVHDIIAGHPTFPGHTKRTVIGGMNEVPKRLAEQFVSASPRHKIRLNNRVESIWKIWSGGQQLYQLSVTETHTLNGHTRDKWVKPQTVCAKTVIMALPAPAMQKIHWYPFQFDPLMKMAFDAVTDFSAMKIFLAYPHAWWDDFGAKSKAYVTDIPLRQGAEFGRFRNSSGDESALMMVSYADGEVNNDYWRELRNFRDTVSSPAIPAKFSVSTQVVDHVHHHLATIYDVRPGSIPRPLDGVMHIWNQDEQNGGAWQRYNPGVKPKVVSKFMERPSKNDNVFVISNSFSRSLSTWAEGSLRAADDVLLEYFNVT